MELEIVILSEVSQIEEEEILSDITCMWNLKKKKVQMNFCPGSTLQFTRHAGTEIKKKVAV